MFRRSPSAYAEASADKFEKPAKALASAGVQDDARRCAAAAFLFFSRSDGDLAR
jgi:hypothetical protein